MAWHTANLTAIGINAPKKFPSEPRKYFTWLVDAKDAWKQSKAQMRRFAERHNQNCRGGSK